MFNVKKNQNEYHLFNQAEINIIRSNRGYFKIFDINLSESSIRSQVMFVIFTNQKEKV